MVDDDWFDDAVFIGDSRTVGLRDYGGLDNATFYASTGLGIYDMWTEKFCEVDGEKTTLEDALSRRQFGKIEADALQVRKVEQVMSTLGTAVPEQVDFDIPELCSGESVIFEMTDSTAVYHVIDSVGDDFYRVNAQKFNAELG